MQAFERPKFEVYITIDKVTNVPYSTGKVYVAWNVTESPRPETRGRTAGVELHHNMAAFHKKMHFPQRIGIRTPSNLLRATGCTLTVIWEPLGSRGMTIGEITLDLSQFAKSDGTPQAFLLENARANCLLSVGVKMEHLRGPTNYKVPELTAPALCNGASLEQLVEDTRKKSAHHSSMRVDHRVVAKIRDDVLAQLQNVSSKVSAKEAMDDLFCGGDGFCGKPHPQGNDSGQHEEGRPWQEAELRENFVSWKLHL